MIKSRRNIIIVLTFIILFIIGIIVLCNIDVQKDEEITPFSENVYTVYQKDANDISKIEIIGIEDNITVFNTGNSVWTINNMSADDIDTSKAYAVAGTITHLTSKNKIADNPSDLSEYGLDNPSLTIKITDKNSSEDVLYIGDKSPTLGEYFIMRKGDTTVYTIYEFKVDTLRKPLSYYREFNRFKINIDDITSIKIIREDETIFLKILEDIDINTNNVWEMLSPYVSGANDDYIDNKILAPIENISLTSPVNSDGGITDKSPVLILTVNPYDNITGKYSGEYTETLTIGDTINGETFIKYKENIYAVSSEAVSFINELSFNVVSKMQALVDISKVKNVTLEYGNEKHVMSIAKSGPAFEFKLDNDTADRDLSQKMYQALISLAVDGIYNNQPLGETMLQITYEGNTPSDDTNILIREIDNLNCSLTRNGKTEFTIKKSKVNEFISLFTSYKNNYR